MDEDLLEVNIGFNEFDDEVGLELENELLDVKDGEEKIESCTNDSSLKTSKDERNPETKETVKDLRDRLKSRSSENATVSSSNVSDSELRNDTGLQRNESQENEGECATGEKRRKTGLDSSETTFRNHEEICSEDEDEKMDVQPGAKRKRGGVKRKRKRQRGDTQPVDTGLGMLLKPLDVKKCATWRDLAREIIYRLNEPKKRLIYKVVEVIGVSDAWALFKDTVKVQKGGGLWINNGKRRRSNGGVFLYLLKARGYATDEQYEEIFKEENERAKSDKKTQNKMDVDQEPKDLRKVIDDKKSELLSMEIEKASIT